ncbi:Down syndrome cell adhesion molecule-like protein Dscam2 [Stegodyphus dumicola]|uniref:Down syndrome cell adhesion molecule-like protein Dscam2 n=1 Tax=Stegodyphus dumicola TaxID=202533 RepID=UPI0015AA5377|nr:Down syndrome cell adhesion molecule-like protein Dscam2 [Stegodyphus dumicola]
MLIFSYIGLILVWLTLSSSGGTGLRRPKIKPFHFTNDVRPGARTAVMCTIVEGDPPFTFEWIKDETKISENVGLAIKIVDEYTSTLAITKLDQNSNGNYTCKVTNAAGKDEQTDVLLMKGILRPEIKPFHFSGGLKPGKRVSVTCSVIDGDPPFTFRWLKDGTPLSESDRLALRRLDEFNSNLAFTKLSPEDNGNYTCHVTNGAGEAQQSDLLTMKGKNVKHPFTHDAANV